MDNDIDDVLLALARRPVPPQLAIVDGRVLRQIGGAPASTPARRPSMTVGAIFFAAILGATVGCVTDQPASRAQLSLDAGAALAPSTLLAGS